MWNWFTNLFKINESASRRAMLGGLVALPLLKYIPGPSSGYIPLQQIPLSKIRTVLPSQIAYDICGVQPMTGPTGQIFAFKTRYGVLDAQTTSYHADLPGGVRCTTFGYAPDRTH